MGFFSRDNGGGSNGNGNGTNGNGHGGAAAVAEPRRAAPAAPPPPSPEALAAIAVRGHLRQDDVRKLKWRLVDGLTKELREGDVIAPPEALGRMESALAALFDAEKFPLPDAVKAALLADVMSEIMGFGPIQALLDDASVSEVMVNRANRVYVERKGKPMLTDVKFDDDAHVRRVIDRIIIPLGRFLDSKNPLVDARLPDGSRVNACIPPVAIDGPCITIRKFGKNALSHEDLIRFGAMTAHMAEFLRACVASRLNIVVSGGTGSGKTTLLNVLSSFIPPDERVVTIEDAAELKLMQDQVIRLESRKPDLDGTGTVSIRDLVRNALRMRPERIVVGECRGGETLDMLQAMNTGHDGSLTTLHANTPRDAVSRIETMALMGGIDFPVKVVREQIASAVHLIIQQTRLRDGSRKVTNISEIGGMEGDRLTMQEVFRFVEDGTDAEGKVVGRLIPTGIRPRFQQKLEQCGFKLPPEMFMERR